MVDDVFLTRGPEPRNKLIINSFSCPLNIKHRGNPLKF